MWSYFLFELLAACACWCDFASLLLSWFRQGQKEEAEASMAAAKELALVQAGKTIYTECKASTTKPGKPFTSLRLTECRMKQ